MAIIIEVTDPNTRGIHRYILDHSNITIGRGYHNDVIISDPYADPLHARLDVEDDRITVSDLDSLNGVYDEPGSLVAGEVALQSGDTITIGQTRLRILNSDHPLPETLRLETVNPSKKGIGFWLAKPLVAIALCCLAIAIYLDNLYLDTYRQEPFSYYLIEGTTFLIGLLAITGLISLIGKVAQKQWSFAANISFISLLISFEALIQQPLSVVYFNYSIIQSKWVIDAVLATFAIAVATAIFLYNLPLKRLLYKQLIIASITLMSFGTLYISDQQSNEKRRHYQIPMSQVFIKTQLPWMTGKSEEAFAEQSSNVYEIDLADYEKP